MKHNTQLGSNFGAGVNANKGAAAGIGLDGRYLIECFDKHGVLKWRDYIENVVTDQGQEHALDVTLHNGSANATWYIALTDGTPTVAETDTYQSHAGWTEVTAYSESVRQTWTPGSISSSSVDNSASPAAFSINSDSTTVGGAALVSESTKGASGAGPILYSVGAFSGGDKSLDDGDTLNVTATFTAADA